MLKKQLIYTSSNQDECRELTNFLRKNNIKATFEDYRTISDYAYYVYVDIFNKKKADILVKEFFHNYPNNLS